MARLMALDVGDRRIGVAISDPLGLFARPLATIDRRQVPDALESVRQLCNSWEVTRLVVGLPLLPSGDHGEQAYAAEAFASALASRTDVPVELWDESYTTVEAEARMRSSGRSDRHRKDRVDAVAAAVLLEEWLAAHDDGVGCVEDEP